MIVICNYSHKNIILLSLIISLIVFIFLNQIFFKNQSQIFDNSLEKIIPDNVQVEIQMPNNAVEQNYVNQVATANFNSSLWQIEIPKINLVAPIEEGTTTEIMNEYVGHFTETPKDNGNIGLAAHNRGYRVNYFEKLKLLKENDLIIYTYKEKVSKYKVSQIGIIKDTDWSKLENTKENKLTLITCLENEPEYRRFVQAIKIEN